MDAIKRDRSNLFWSEWETVTERTRHLLKRHTGHSIMLTVDPCALSYAERQYKYQHKRKAAPTAATVKTAEKVEPVQKFPPLIIPQ